MKLKSILKTLFIISIICGINSCKEKKNEKIKEVKVVNENKKLGLKNAVVLNLKNLEKNKKLDFKEKYIPENYVKQTVIKKDKVLEKGIELINKMTE